MKIKKNFHTEPRVKKYSPEYTPVEEGNMQRADTQIRKQFH